MTRVVALLLLPVLGLLFLFVFNPGKTPLRLRVVGVLASSLLFAPFVVLVYYGSPEHAPAEWYRRVVASFLGGPFFFLTFTGLNALNYFAHQLPGPVSRWWRRGGGGSPS